MTKLNKRTKCMVAVVALLILFGILLRNMWQLLPSNDLRGLIYVGIFTAWGISVRRRIIQEQVRRYMTFIAVLMVFWVVVRTMKFHYYFILNLVRFCWYSYYFPMLFIPLLMLLIAMSLGKPENYRLPKFTNYLFLFSATLCVLVMTNDFHQLAFGFPKGLLFIENNDYTHEFVYYISIMWMAICTLSAFAVMVAKCHVPGNKKRIWLPIIPVIAMFIYAVLYVTVFDFIKPIAGDMTVVSCLLAAATLESCIQCGLIQSNAHYSELFECTGIRAKIADKYYNILLSSTDTQQFSKDQMRQTETAPIMLDNGYRLCGAPIKSGYVLWSEDVSEITEVIAELADNSEYLTTRKTVLHKEVETRKEEQRLIEQNRLYNRLMNDNQEKFTLFSDLISYLETTTDTDEEKNLTAKLAVVCTHIKRRGNLLFLAENEDKINASELQFALEEWLSNLRLCGVKCGLYSGVNSPLTFAQTVILYDTFQRVLLYTLDTLHSLLVTADEIEDRMFLLLNICCDCELSGVSYPNVDISDEGDGEWIITISVSKRGATSE